MNFQLIHHGRYSEPVSNMELFGNNWPDDGPIFKTRAEAEMYCQQCENAWPEGSEVREDYDIVETDKMITAKMSAERVHHLVDRGA